ncbi:MAG: hypothetical protein JO089_07115 [Alphaproteobacteria bacterium]|nr:hypothetical protein [Alphaproteobacteria bacterium]
MSENFGDTSDLTLSSGKPAEEYIRELQAQAPRLSAAADLLDAIREEGKKYEAVSGAYITNGEPNPFFVSKYDYYINNSDEAAQWREGTKSRLENASVGLRAIVTMVGKLDKGEEHIDHFEQNTTLPGSVSTLNAAIDLLSEIAKHRTTEKVFNVKTLRAAQAMADELRTQVMAIVGDGTEMNQKLLAHDEQMIPRTTLRAIEQRKEQEKLSPEQKTQLKNLDFVTGVMNINAQQEEQEIRNPEESQTALSRRYTEKFNTDADFRTSEERKAAERGKPSALLQP